MRRLRVDLDIAQEALGDGVRVFRHPVRLSHVSLRENTVPRMARPAGNASGPRLQKADPDQTASLSSFAARKATFLLALILIGSPVAGLRPMRAARLRTCRMPSPPIRMRSPFFRCFTTRSTMLPRMASECFLASSCCSATFAARCFRVTVGAVVLLAAMGNVSFVVGKGTNASYARPISDSCIHDYVEMQQSRGGTHNLLRIDGQILAGLDLAGYGSYLSPPLRKPGNSGFSGGVAQLVRAPACH